MATFPRFQVQRHACMIVPGAASARHASHVPESQGAILRYVAAAAQELGLWTPGHVLFIACPCLRSVVWYGLPDCGTCKLPGPIQCLVDKNTNLQVRDVLLLKCRSGQ